MSNLPLFRLGSADFIKGLATAVIAGIVVGVGTVLHGTVTAPDFSIFGIDWAGLWHAVVNNAVIGAEGGFSGYILKNFISDEKGAVLGKWGGKELYPPEETAV